MMHANAGTVEPYNRDTKERYESNLVFSRTMVKKSDQELQLTEGSIDPRWGWAARTRGQSP
jgi:hypothetical protein